jgi:hypothetical protein
MIDPIGTVRRHGFTGGFELWAVIADRRATADGDDVWSSQWLCIWASDPAFVGSDLPPKQIEECLLVGTIPGTPARDAESSDKGGAA